MNAQESETGGMLEFAHLGRWERVLLARHPSRPAPLDYIARLVPDFLELHGDRVGGEDPAIAGGVGTLAGRAVVIVAHARTRDRAELLRRREGKPLPEGLRKAARLARLADRLGLPLVTFVDTPGAYPGAEAEERGQAMAIAQCLVAMAEVRSPVVSCVVGEGGSGGALALAVADRLLIQENAIFEVISPEACSSILYRDGAHAREAAEALRLTSSDLAEHGLVNVVVAEPPGGAHRDAELAAVLLERAVTLALDELSAMDESVRLERRHARLRAYGSEGLGSR